MDPIAQLLQPKIGEIKEEFTKDGKWALIHYHASSTPNDRSKVEMKSYEVGGTTGRGKKRINPEKNKRPFFEKGMFCPKCFRIIKN